MTSGGWWQVLVACCGDRHKSSGAIRTAWMIRANGNAARALASCTAAWEPPVNRQKQHWSVRREGGAEVADGDALGLHLRRRRLQPADGGVQLRLGPSRAGSARPCRCPSAAPRSCPVHVSLGAGTGGSNRKKFEICPSPLRRACPMVASPVGAGGAVLSDQEVQGRAAGSLGSRGVDHPGNTRRAARHAVLRCWCFPRKGKKTALRRSTRRWGMDAAQELIGRHRSSPCSCGSLTSLAAGPRALLLEGEAGIGKTALWEAGLAHARAAGQRALACRPAGSEVRLSFAALGDLLAEASWRRRCPPSRAPAAGAPGGAAAGRARGGAARSARHRARRC